MKLVELRAEKIGLSAPFTLEIPEKPPVQCLKIFRHLPGRRVVFLAQIENQRVLVKLFFQKKYFDRESNGLHAMQMADVSYPKEVWRMAVDGEGYLLATEFLDGAVSLNMCYKKYTKAQLKPLLREALCSISRLHQAGWMQADIHLDNFLFNQGQLYVIDGGGVCALKNPCNNLGLFFAQMTPSYDVLITDILGAYGQQVPELAVVLKTVQAQREWRIKHYLAKCLRNCTQFVTSSPRGHFVAMARQSVTPLLNNVMAQPDQSIVSGKPLKKGNTATVVVIVGDDSDWVIKRYNIKNLWHGLRRSFRSSRACVSWENAHRLELLGIATPKPLAMRENRLGLWRKEAYLLTENIAGESLKSWSLSKESNTIPAWIDNEICNMFAIFFDARVSHGDMKATNLLLAGEKLYVLDLDAMRWHGSKKAFNKAFGKDLQRFMANWEGEVWQHFEQLLRPFGKRIGLVMKRHKQ